MYVLIPAAGYGTRLYPLTKDKPKALLDINKKPLIWHILDKVLELPEITKIIIISNGRFYRKFCRWQSNLPKKSKIEILNDGTKSEKERLGAIGDLNLAIERYKINEDILVVNSDNLFDFSLMEIYAFFKEKKAPIVGLYDVKSREKAQLYGVIKINPDNKIIDFREKPKNPESTLISTGIYLFPKNTIKFFAEYLAGKNSSDKSGYFLEWLYKKMPAYGFTYKNKKWFDIGSFESLEEANHYFKDKK